MIEADATLSSSAGWRLDHSYARLPERLYARVKPTPVGEPGRVIVNRELAASLGLDVDRLDRDESAALFVGNELPEGADPLAQAYAGHQYGHFTMLGDGRAILLGEQMTPDGRRYDVQLKGAGPTPYSRRGDGRAALGPMLREYIISEAMAALGIPTTRSLAVATTGEWVLRDGALPGAVLTRIAASHIRVGTMEWAAARGDGEALSALVGHTIERHYPELGGDLEPAAALLRAVSERQAALIARWQLVGFVHGVMNTDNMALSGETIDYGPCAFMDAYDPATVFSSIDHHGRYAYGNQPAIARWNLARLAEALLPLLHAEEGPALERANEVLGAFAGRFQEHWLRGIKAKLGLIQDEPGDRALIDDLLEGMRLHGADYTLTFRGLSEEGIGGGDWMEGWRERWRSRVAREAGGRDASLALMRKSNPRVIPRNHKVEEVLAAAVEGRDWGPMHRLLAVLARPYEVGEVQSEYAVPAPSGSVPYRTFCGT